jgi:hypothetical protein
MNNTNSACALLWSPSAPTMTRTPIDSCMRVEKGEGAGGDEMRGQVR